MIPLIYGISALAGLAALLLKEKPVEKNKDVEPLTNKETNALKKLANTTDNCLQDIVEKLQDFIPPFFEFWITVNNEGKTSISWQWVKGENGGYIGRLTNDNLFNLMKSVHAVDWDKQVDLSKEQAEKFKEFARELDTLKSRESDFDE